MLYTVTVVLYDRTETNTGANYLEQVYLTDSEADSEETIAAEVRRVIDSERFEFVMADDVRPLLFDDFSDAVFAKHFDDAAVHTAVWAEEEPDA